MDFSPILFMVTYVQYYFDCSVMTTSTKLNYNMYYYRHSIHIIIIRVFMSMQTVFVTVLTNKTMIIINLSHKIRHYKPLYAL